MLHCKLRASFAAPFFFPPPIQSKKPAGDTQMKVLFKRYYKMISLGTATYKEKVLSFVDTYHLLYVLETDLFCFLK